MLCSYSIYFSILADIFGLKFKLNLIFYNYFFSIFLPVQFIEAIIFLCHHKVRYTLFNYLPESFSLDNTLQEISYNISICLYLNSSDKKAFVLFRYC